MARDFDGANDRVTLTQHASLNDWDQVSLCAWISPDSIGELSSGRIFDKVNNGPPGAFVFRMSQVGAGQWNLTFLARRWGTTVGEWITGASTIASGGVRQHVAVSYDFSSTANDPTIYINGVAQSLTETQTPAGSTAAAETKDLVIGDRGPADRCFDGRIGFAVASNEAFSAADVNRALWWGRPKGGLGVYHPFMTDKLANEGIATADGVDSGGSIPIGYACPAVRPGSAMMCGVGF